MLFHQNLPIYAVEDHTVGSEHALQASFNCPTEFISQAPPTLVTENYCFVVDGNAVNEGTLNMDVEWWKPTSHPTHYYYSEDYKTFRRVHIVTVKGRIVGARIRGVVRKQPSPPPPQARSPSITPSRSPSIALPAPAGPPLPPMVVHKNVSLSNVFRVGRYYSYWKTCAHFHRIITVITPVKEMAQVKWKRRVFFQFLWHRDAKESDKLRVAMEYAPARQAQLLQPRGSSFSAGPSSMSPQSGSGGSNPPSGSVSPRAYQEGDEAGPSSSGIQDYNRRPSAPTPSGGFKRQRRTSSIFQL